MIGGKAPAPRKKHHYLPIFYLKRWSGMDGKICEFSKPYGQVVRPKRVHPAGTAYEKYLYSLKSYPPGLSDQIEANFFSPVDSLAADALQLLERRDAALAMNASQRSAWSRFLIGLDTRGPEDVRAFWQLWRKRYLYANEHSEREYAKIRPEDLPATLKEFLESTPEQEIEKSGGDLFPRLIDNASIGQTINEMIWKILEFPNSRFELLTSDRPVIRSNVLNSSEGHIALPIGPRRLFVAATREETFLALSKRAETSIVVECNQHCVKSALKYSYGTDDQQFRFISNRMSRNTRPSLFERVAEGLFDGKGEST